MGYHNKQRRDGIKEKGEGIQKESGGCSELDRSQAELAVRGRRKKKEGSWPRDAWVLIRLGGREEEAGGKAR